MVETHLTEAAVVRESPRLSPDDSLTFRCGRDLGCFTHCCGDVAIVLTPYDVLRMKRALGLDSTEFLEGYTLLPFTREQRVPVLLLKMDPATKRCPFVGDQGCRIYGARPWACRMYPLGIAEPRMPSEDDKPFHFLVRDGDCLGHGLGGPLTVREWRDQQGIDDYDMHATSFKELMLHEFWDKDEALSPQKLEMYYTACYDIDRFRRFVFESSFLDRFEVDPVRVEALRQDDEELLEFATQWLRFCLFGERTMRPKPASVEGQRRVRASRVAQGEACDGQR